MNYFDQPNMVSIDLDLDSDLIKELQQMADDRGISIDEVIAQAIQARIEKEK